MIKANELRINNILNYTTAENDIMTSTLDWQDIKWISEDPKGFNLVHDPILLTEEWLLKFGFEKYCNDKYSLNGDCFSIGFSYNHLDLMYGGYNESPVRIGKEIGQKYVHQLQNLYFALTGQELELK